MLLTEITGHNSRKKLCGSVIQWFDAKYLKDYTIDLTVHHRGLRREGVFGWCTPETDDINPREFLVEVHNRLDVDAYVKILLHELWHVYQHVRGDLVDYPEKRCWKGIDHTETNYEDQPWEKEAVEMENELYEEYLES